MKYISTRGKSPELNFSDVLLSGLAPDGGLYLPKNYPLISNEDLSLMRTMSYPELAFFIFSKYIDDIPFEDLKSIVEKTYTKKVYGFSRKEQNAADITPTLKLKENLHLLSLSN
jgi:threonine synthase